MKLKIEKDGKIVSYMDLQILSNGDIEILFAETNIDYRNLGLSSLLLKKAIAISNKMNKRLITIINPAKGGGMTYNQELNWLLRYGFKPLKNYKYEGQIFHDVMIYKPK